MFFSAVGPCKPSFPNDMSQRLTRECSACVASILRITQLHHLNGVDVTCMSLRTPLPLRCHSATDIEPFSDQTVGSLNWSVVEVGTAIICASLSALRPLASRTLPKFFHHFSNLERTPNLNSSQATSNLSTSKNVRIASNPTNVPTSKFSTLESREESENGSLRRVSSGTVVVERTFDVTELNEFPLVSSIPPMSLVQVPKRVSSRKNIGLFTDTARLFEKSSEEDLVKPRSPNRGPNRNYN